jgi:hypothetical protein
MNPIITIPEADLVAVLGDDGERWVQGTWDDDEGGACLHGAIRRCQPVPGDAYLIEEVARRQGWGTGWNDNPATSWPMIRAQLAHVKITDADLADTFGPQWEAIVALVRRASVLTADEAQRLAAAWGAARAAARAAARVAARDAGWVAARAAVWAAGRAAARDAGWVAARDAASVAAGALAARDLIGQHGFTQAHYDLLTGPWRTLIGPVHPDDAEVAS